MNDILTLTLERRLTKYKRDRFIPISNKKIAVQSKLQNPNQKEIIAMVKELKRRLEEYNGETNNL